MNVNLPAVNINANSTMDDVKRYLVSLVDAIEIALQSAKEEDDA